MDLEFELSPTDQPWYMKREIEYEPIEEI